MLIWELCHPTIGSHAFSLSPLTTFFLSDELVILEGYSVWHKEAVTHTLWCMCQFSQGPFCLSIQAQPGRPCSIPGSASLASLPAWPMDDRRLLGMTGDRERGRKRRAKNVPTGKRRWARDKAKERGKKERLKEWNYSKGILIKWNSTCKRKWIIFKIRVQSRIGNWKCGQYSDFWIWYHSNGVLTRKNDRLVTYLSAKQLTSAKQRKKVKCLVERNKTTGGTSLNLGMFSIRPSIFYHLV